MRHVVFLLHITALVLLSACNSNDRQVNGGKVDGEHQETRTAEVGNKKGAGNHNEPPADKSIIAAKSPLSDLVENGTAYDRAELDLGKANKVVIPTRHFSNVAAPPGNYNYSWPRH
jgi:hypothetical protein